MTVLPRRRWSVPVTVTVAAVTAAVSVVALLDPRIAGLLTRDEPLVRAGQWWRLVTPVLVQPDGWGQFAFNLAGIVVVGAALERRVPPWSWFTVYVTAGVGAVVVLTVLRPGDRGGGSSDAVAGLIAALAVTEARRPGPETGWAAALAAAYSAFFCAYLTALDLAGVWPAMIAGDLAVAIVLAARRHAGVGRTAVGLVTVVGVAGVVMAVRLDGHGLGLLLGGVLAVVAGPALRPRVRRARARATSRSPSAASSRCWTRSSPSSGEPASG